MSLRRVKWVRRSKRLVDGREAFDMKDEEEGRAQVGGDVSSSEAERGGGTQGAVRVRVYAAAAAAAVDAATPTTAT